MSELEKLSYLMKGVIEDNFQLLVAKDPLKVAGFSKARSTFEVTRRSSLCKRTFPRLFRVTSSSSMVDAKSISRRVGEDIREEVRVILTTHFYSCFDATSGELTLQDTIRY